MAQGYNLTRMDQKVVTKPGEEFVLGEEFGHVRLLTLNDPRRLNILSRDLTVLLREFLEKWEKDDDAQLILIKGSGRAFSAGGDLKMFCDERRSMGRFLELIYSLYFIFYHIHTYKKTKVALAHGISMGAGASLMVAKEFSVVTEKTVFAMPEVIVGFHPDCGFSFVFSRLPGRLGEFLGLTGANLNGKEIIAAGLATHFVPSEKLMELQNRLISLNTGEVNAVRSAIEEFSVDVQIDEKSVLNKRTIIDECFSKDSMEEILTSFETEASKEGNGWIFSFLKGLKRSSPTSLKIILQSIREGRKKTLAECLKQEFRIATNIFGAIVSSDFYEGTRAVLIDKDNSPKWEPPTLEAVDAEKINLVFQPFEAQDLELNIPIGEEDFRWEGKYDDSPYTGKKSLQSRL